jgi:manganese/zinc/iron transport system ATP- binding protein
MQNKTPALSPVLSVEKLTLIYQQDPVVLDLTLEVFPGSMVAIVGPNGAGKTTLLKALTGLIKPVAGDLKLFGTPIAQVSREQRNRIAYVPQRMSVDWDFPISVQEVVMMGRYGHLGWLRRPRKIDYEIVAQALESVDLTAHASTPIAYLSGGQQQRVFLARALAQQADIYLLDEPLVNLDMVTERALVRVLQDLAAQGKTVLVIHHDLHTVRRYFDTALLLNIKKIAYGPANMVMADSYLARAYGGEKYTGEKYGEDKYNTREYRRENIDQSRE